MESKGEPGYGLEDYLKVVRKRIWLLIVIFVPVVTGVAIVSYKMTPIYQATALLRIEKRRLNVVDIQDVYQFETRPDDYYETQYRILKSRMICKEVFEKLELVKLQKYEDSKEALNSFMKDLIVAPVSDTYLVHVSYESEDAKLSAKVANAIVDEYVSAMKREKKVVSDEAESKITTQIPLLRQRLTESETALRQFEQENSALSFQKNREIIYQTLSSLNAQLTKINQEMAAAKADMVAVKEAKTIDEILSLPEITQNFAIQNYQREKLLFEAEKARLAQEYTPDSEEMKTIDSRLKVAETRIKEDALRIAEGIKLAAKMELVKKQKESEELKSLVTKQEELAKSIDTRMYQNESLKAEVEGNRKLYEEFVQRQKELQSSSQFDPGTVQIVDRAEVPAFPVRPKKMLNIILAVVLSLLTGIGLAFLFEHMDDSIKGHEDIERYIKLPLLGIVPSFKTGKISIEEKDLISHHKPKSNISEAYRNIRTNLVYASPNQDAKAYVVSSSEPQEGKTTTAINLAVALAHAGKKVLLVDSDLRKPRIHRTFKVDGGKGMTNYLVGQSSLDDVISETEVENLSMVPSGPIPPNPAELLGSAKMKEFIAQAKKNFDAVVFDSPPLVAVTDAAVLAAQSDGAIQVIWAGHTSRKVIEFGKEKVESIGAKVIGVILNNMKVTRSGYYYPQYYHKYYGSDESTSSGK